MAIKPILFSTPMVQAILEGRKTQTRRIITKVDQMIPFSDKSFSYLSIDGCFVIDNGNGKFMDGLKPKFNIDDVLWVRETWQNSEYTLNGFTYKANAHPEKTGKWKPSIFMPKEAARIFLKVNGVRVERLHEISEPDAISEGIEKMSGWKNRLVENLYTNYMKDGRGPQTPRLSFFSLWESINGKESLASNPWVWVYDFCKVERPSDFI